MIVIMHNMYTSQNLQRNSERRKTFNDMTKPRKTKHTYELFWKCLAEELCFPLEFIEKD